MIRLRRTLAEFRHYPSAVAGLAIIAILILISIYTIVTIPYSEAVRLWRGGVEVWKDSPKNAKPSWFNLFTKRNNPETIVISSKDDSVQKTTEVISEDITDVAFDFTFDYTYDGFPQEITLFFETQYQEKAPYVSLYWLTPDGREIRVGDFSADRNYTHRISLDERLKRRLGGQFPEEGLFADPDAEGSALKGRYTMQIRAATFEDDAQVDAEMVIYGQVHGLTGTDHHRRDLTVALLWGTPIALSFGLIAALGTSVITMIIAGVGAWFGGWVDDVIQRVTEVNLILPVLPILIMIGTFYSRSLVTMLGVLVLLNIFGGAIKNYRAVFLQVRESPYIEAAQAYGAGNWRIVFRYLIPRVIPLLIPRLVILIPTFVFTEAALAVLGLGDPVLPTWGKIINDAYNNGALYQGHYYWFVEPSILLMLTGFAFALLGYSLDRIFNPRLRGV